MEDEEGGRDVQTMVFKKDENDNDEFLESF